MHSLYQEIRPSAQLAAAVECFWTNQALQDYEQVVLPDGCMDVLLRFRGTLYAVDLVGAMTRPETVSMRKGEFYLGIRFKPGWAGAYVSHAALLANQTSALSAIAGANAVSFTRFLRKAWTTEDRVSVLEQAFRLREDVSPAQLAIDHLTKSQGDASLEELHDIAHLGDRQFRRYCLQRTGLSPKLLSRILRFRKAAETLRMHGDRNFAQLAVDLGYYDQAHMIRDFKQFAGQTPLVYAAATDRPVEA